MLSKRLASKVASRFSSRYAMNLSNQKRFMSSEHEETYEEYTKRYVDFFKNEADDNFELSRGLNNAFCTDIVPPPEVLVEAMRAARRLNNFVLAARTIEALREKLLDDKIYKEYLDELKPVMEELGVPSPEELNR